MHDEMPGFFPGRPGGEHDEPLLDTILATSPASRPATTRSMMISAWSGGSDLISAIAACVDTASRAWSAASGVVSSCAASVMSSGTAGRRARDRPASAARFLAMVNSHARKSCSPPRKRRSPVTTWTQVSPATSSGSVAITRR